MLDVADCLHEEQCILPGYTPHLWKPGIQCKMHSFHAFFTSTLCSSGVLRRKIEGLKEKLRSIVEV